jgi:hypothetical protein
MKQSKRVFWVLALFFISRACLASPRPQEPELLLNLPGMGTAFSWNIGVIHALYEKLSAVRDNRVVLTANSGGAVPALFFSCKGFSEESIRRAEDLVKSFPAEIANEDMKTKFFLILLGIAPEFEAAPLVKAIHKVIDEDCKPNYSVIIGVGNSEVSERRSFENYVPKIRPKTPQAAIALQMGRIQSQGLIGSAARLLSGKNLLPPNPTRNIFGRHGNKLPVEELKNRYLDQSTNMVYDRQDEDSPFEPVGKVCTYFMSPDQFELYQDDEDLLCDLRLMETAWDMRKVMEWAVDEPTYFFPGREVDQAKLIREGKLIVSRAQMARAEKNGVPFVREYNGGIVIPGAPARDIVKKFPHLDAISSGRPYWVEPPDTKPIEIDTVLYNLASKISPQFTTYLEHHKDPVSNPVEGGPRFREYYTPPLATRTLMLRGWYGFDVNLGTYLDQSLMDVMVEVPEKFITIDKVTGAERNKVLPEEIRMGYEAALACFTGEKKCKPLTADSVPKLPPQKGKDAEFNSVRVKGPDGTLRLMPEQKPPTRTVRPVDWRPKLDLPVEEKKIFAP